MSQPQICSRYSRTGTCKFDTECRYRHVSGGVEEETAPTKSRVCSHYSRTGTCKFGTECKYSHVDAGVEAVTEGTTTTSTNPPNPQLSSPGQIDEFFALYPLFKPNTSAPIISEFNRLCTAYHWGKENPEKEKARALFKYAMIYEFNGIYGAEVDDPASWWKLCQVLELPAFPASADACRQAVEGVYVNIVDLIDAPRTGEKVRVFRTEKELSRYTKESGKVFSMNGYAGGLLEYLYRRIVNRHAEPRQGKGKESLGGTEEAGGKGGMGSKKEARLKKSEFLREKDPLESTSEKRPQHTGGTVIIGLNGAKRSEGGKKTRKENQKTRDSVRENLRSEKAGKRGKGREKRGFDAKVGVRDFVV
ncbi:hypothetical protein JAAARDRAFT_161918 [Jaapia argillacea MUCL 33604]|uniref:C3H1-type domain-containing protein n=1 Tax=Jaapia argillacea MUCL 33604 TaxID=933084 RepID=A0A067PQ17_9AGAM|nr:hypothetical protein JAAARDRAFT_161918 [Jaapia argillacea MUCL 33604]